MCRRCDIQQMNPAELAILEAMKEVEKMPADTRLTNAIVRLSDAQRFVADFIDDKESL